MGPKILTQMSLDPTAHTHWGPGVQESARAAGAVHSSCVFASTPRGGRMHLEQTCILFGKWWCAFVECFIGELTWCSGTLHVGTFASALFGWHSRQTSALTMMYNDIDIRGVAVLAHGDATGDQCHHLMCRTGSGSSALHR